jgi:hypothetical protein
MRDKNDSSSTLLGRPWLFPAAYLLHIVEETRGVGVPNGFKLTMTQFFVYSGAAWALMVVGVWLGRRHGFSQFMQLCLGSVFLVNGFTHLFKSARFGVLDAGVVTGTLLFVPLGALALGALWGAMGRRRYFVGVGLGLLMQAVATILSQ